MPERINRHFLGWDEPALPAAAAWLLDRTGGESGEADLSDLVVVLPGGRARRVLTGLLVDMAAERKLVLTPPHVITPGQAVVALLGACGEPATPIACRVAWIKAMQQGDEKSLAPLMHHPIDAHDLLGLSRLAATLERMSNELAAAGLRFSDVECLDEHALPQEEKIRWRVLGMIQDSAEHLLKEQSLVDSALAAISKALTTASPDHAREADVVLIGIAEMSRVDRAAFERGARTIDVLVIAPETLADRFDEIGCVRVEEWAAASVDLDEDRVVFADNPRDQAERALVHLASRADPVDVGKVVIGAADPKALANLRRRAALTSGVNLHAGQGEAVSHSSMGRLLSLLGAHLREGTFDTLGALVRHPEIESALLARPEGEDAVGTGQCAHARAPGKNEWWLTALDSIRREHVLTDPKALPASLQPRDAEALRFVLGGFDELFGDLAKRPDDVRPLTNWEQALENALRSIFAERELNLDSETDQRTIEELKAVRSALDELGVAASRGANPLEATAWQTISLLEERLANMFVPEVQKRDTIEVLGWLELAMDPTPTCVVVGLTESCVPGSVTHDAFLPDSLRAHLGLTTNEARLARDIYLLAAINASRDAVFITTRHADKGDPQTPSRLLFRCAGEQLAQRVHRFTCADDKRPRITLASRMQAGEEDRFAPQLTVGAGYTAPTSMRVTDFGAYLRSPAGWYLERYLQLSEHEEPLELAPKQYGTLVHKVLETFGRDETTRDLDDPKKIETALSEALTDIARCSFGANPVGAVRLQTELLRHRLGFFASQQAQRRREGWRIMHVEWSPDADDPKASLDVDGLAMGLRGKIDRIDLHEDGRCEVIDYKTGLGAKDARKSHRRRDNTWKILQLPLYAHLIGELGFSGDVEFSYAGLPSKDRENVWSSANWTTEELQSADEAARDVVRRIRSCHTGDAIELGDHPPSAGALGFITGKRFDIGGRVGGVELAAVEAS